MLCNYSHHNGNPEFGNASLQIKRYQSCKHSQIALSWNQTLKSFAWSALISSALAPRRSAAFISFTKAS